MRKKEAKNKKAVAVIENTAELEVKPPEVPTNGNGHKPPEITPHSWDNAFKSSETPNSLRYVVEAGDNPEDLLMRTFLPSRKTDSYRLAVAFATAMRKCREAGDTEGEKEFRDILALLPSMDGRSREQLVSSLIGQIVNNARYQAGGFMENLKNKAEQVWNRDK
jgi:hypothetical protein